jgi:hypothetical protein
MNVVKGIHLLLVEGFHACPEDVLHVEGILLHLWVGQGFWCCIVMMIGRELSCVEGVRNAHAVAVPCGVVVLGPRNDARVLVGVPVFSSVVEGVSLVDDRAFAMATRTAMMSIRIVVSGIMIFLATVKLMVSVLVRSGPYVGWRVWYVLVDTGVVAAPAMGMHGLIEDAIFRRRPRGRRVLTEESLAVIIR